MPVDSIQPSNGSKVSHDPRAEVGRGEGRRTSKALGVGVAGYTRSIQWIMGGLSLGFCFGHTIRKMRTRAGGGGE